ncbi:restriction endonuclease subunit S [Lacticaseibacillus nasuensis]|uniref:restriction endonuclease subunit S n=1 Tax=Lacticaseibacillus nasuensis TaxID=944671 RepID=UPI0022455DAA|nr:restriction endonuclease subunit S [Lacticaseibacillus nasuensis]MCX2455673.1 restriction endonuclease subunit S [Lacticaseibacillus nasuensis]
MTTNKQMVPELRFKGFTDAWEDRKLSDIADRFDNLRVPITASDRKPGDTPYYGANGIQDYVEGFTHNGEFILVAEDGANDLKNYPVQYVNGKVWVNNHAHVLQGKKTITDNKFLMNAIKNFNIEPFLVGGGRAKLNADVMMKLNILLPTFAEQEKIGSFFKQLDATIALHQRKLEKLQEQKKGYLQKLFPKNGSNFPQLRFKGFTDPWEKRTLGEIATFLNGRAYKQSELLDKGKYRVLRVGNFGTNTQWYYSDLELGEKFYANPGDLLYTWATAFGPHIWDGEKVIYHYHIWKIEVSAKLDKQFTLWMLEADKAKLTANTNGSTMIHVTKGEMESKEVEIPSIKEQTKIGTLLNELDNLIAVNQRKVELLKKLKQAYLQKMFV